MVQAVWMSPKKDLVIYLGLDKTTIESIEQECLPPRWSGGGDGITECNTCHSQPWLESLTTIPAQ